MIIQCEQCRTKFKLDDAKVTERGVKVRCAKCRHVFTVRSPEAAAPEIAAVLPASDTLADEAATLTASSSTVPVFDTNEISFADVGSDEPPFGEAPVATPQQEPETAATGLDFGTVLPQTSELEPSPEISFDFGEARPTTAATQTISFDFTTKPTAVAAAPAGDVDFGSFDFGDISVSKPDDSFSLDGADFDDLATKQPTVASDGDDLGFSFSDAEPQAVTATAGGFDISNIDFGDAQAAASAPASDTVNLDEFEFGTDATSVAVPAADQNETLFNFSQPQEPTAAAAPSSDQPATAAAFVADTPVDEETPPLSITSRRRQSPVVSALIVAACLLLVGALGFMGYLFLGDGSSAHKFFGKPAPVEEGKIVVQKVQATFLTKATAGDLLVITGEAQNNFSKSRAALQVKATLFGASNEPLVSQTAYAGNQLTNEQLVSMPKEKIEAAMNNQFGDSLANLEVPAGKTIPFTLVIINPPDTAKDFGVESVGSTIAASK